MQVKTCKHGKHANMENNALHIPVMQFLYWFLAFDILNKPRYYVFLLGTINIVSYSIQAFKQGWCWQTQH